jgi:hypothetical protein
MSMTAIPIFANNACAFSIFFGCSCFQSITITTPIRMMETILSGQKYGARNVSVVESPRKLKRKMGQIGQSIVTMAVNPETPVNEHDALLVFFTVAKSAIVKPKRSANIPAYTMSSGLIFAM